MSDLGELYPEFFVLVTPEGKVGPFQSEASARAWGNDQGLRCDAVETVVNIVAMEHWLAEQRDNQSDTSPSD